MLNKDMKNKLYAYASKRLGLREYTRGWLKGTCPSCGRLDKFGFNISQFRTNCFVCDYHPNPFNLIMELEGFNDYREVKAFLGAYQGRTYLEPIIERVEKANVVLPDGFKNLRIGNNMVAKAARDYVKSRKFDPDEMSYKGWGYCISGDYMGYIIIPFYVGQKLIYFNGRRFMLNGPKYMNPKIDEFGIGKSLIVYNVDALNIYNTIYVVEGAINAETIGDEGIATGGKKISGYQISMILKSPVKNVILLLDPDAMSDAYSLGLRLLYYKRVKVIQLPEKTDVNDLGKEETLRLVSKTKWMDYQDIISKHIELKS